MTPLPESFDAPLGRKIIELHVWAVGEDCAAPARLPCSTVSVSA
jgi:hypothetical protein